MNLNMPDRKVLVSGIAGLLTWIVVTFASKYGLDVPPDVQAMIPIFVGLVFAYIVPPADQDIVKHITNDLVRQASADKTNPTTAMVVNNPEPPGVVVVPAPPAEPQMIPAKEPPQ